MRSATTRRLFLASSLVATLAVPGCAAEQEREEVGSAEAEQVSGVTKLNLRTVQDGSPHGFVTHGGKTYFTARVSRTAAGGEALWETDGTVAGTRRVVVLPDAGQVHGMVSAAGALWGLVRTGAGYALFRSDGTAAGTKSVLTRPDARLSELSATARGPAWFEQGTVTDDRRLVTLDATTNALAETAVDTFVEVAYFVRGATTTLLTSRGSQVAVLTDGTAAGTRAIASPKTLLRAAPLGSDFVVVRSERVNGVAAAWLARLDTSTMNETKLADIPESFKYELRSNGARAYALVGEGLTVGTLELWGTDGTPAGTARLASGVPISASEIEVAIDPVSGKLGAYRGPAPAFGKRAVALESDGTAAGTRWSFIDGTVDGDQVVPTRVVGGAHFIVDGGAVKRVDVAGGKVDAVYTFALQANPHESELAAAASGRLLVGVGHGDLVVGADVAGGAREVVVNDGADSSSSPRARLRHPSDARAIGTPGDRAEGFVTVGGRAIFTADDGEHGSELWVSDGTAQGTRMLRDLTPGPASTSVYIHPRLLGGLALFTARRCPAYGGGACSRPHEIFATDGTDVGTVKIGDSPGGGLNEGGVTTTDKYVYFYGPTSVLRSDGTAAGTVATAIPATAMVRAVPGGVVATHRGTGGEETWDLWHAEDADGVARRVPMDGVRLYGATVAGTSVYFLSSVAGPHGARVDRLMEYELTTKTVRERRVDVSTGGAPQRRPDDTWCGKTVFDGLGPFHVSAAGVTAWSDARGVWAFDPSGRVTLVADLDPNGKEGATCSPAHAVVNDRLVVVRGASVIATDGTPAGTVVAPIAVAAGHRLEVFATTASYAVLSECAADAGVRKCRTAYAWDGRGAPVELGVGPTFSSAVSNGRLYFGGSTAAHGDELFVTDGTAAGTKVAADVVPGATGSMVGGLTVLGGKLLFAATDGVGDRELYVGTLAP